MKKFNTLNFKTQHTPYWEFLGRYDDDEFYVDQTLNIFFPPLRRMRPSYALLFKIIRLSGEIKISDKIVGWGVFPLINSEMEVNEGKFKTPMVYGDGFKHVMKYRDIEYAIQNDLDKWLCNMYFEIEPLKMLDVWVDLKHKIILYKKPRMQRIKEAINEEIKLETESNPKSFRWSS